MTESLLKPQLEQQQAVADNEIAALKNQIKRGKELVKQGKAQLTRYNAYKRELDAAIATLYPPALSAPREWASVLDIPHGTLVKPQNYDGLLFVTANGEGWYYDAPGDVEYDQDRGWKLDTSEDEFGPFVEVLKEEA
ncbi:hypothetical protein A5630_25320 [Mycolicibacterium mucogenicum]|uniref:Uncharacterized protein n=1 Tax=Mycolicibacterium mucogenicum TaxID=56689 RepID=A0A1A3GY54_MYCMU|nr:hypothetical protein [Mycolicibacterium mucogenicum]OBJ40274.1 hypothetical protein A5630_25320 [Mycolicibacterium mucogenicum]